MFVLHIDLPVRAGEDQRLEKTFASRFRPVIIDQPGFRDTQLMRSINKETDYCLTISFEDETAQQKWVATDVHETVWSAMQSHCTEVAVRKYKTLW